MTPALIQARRQLREALRQREQAKVQLIRAIRDLKAVMPPKGDMLLRKQAG